MKEMAINYKVIYKVNATQWESECFHTYELAKEFAALKGGVVITKKA